jgi:two-component system alkaline phosphatase synthesis response regulator PhoP
VPNGASLYSVLLMNSSITAHTILLVDDEPEILEFLSYNLKKEGFKVFTANSGEEGVKLVQTLSPSLILLDIMMPKMDGIEACQIIRKDLNINQPIIAFLTSRAEDYSQIAGFEAGADDYITKPIRPRLLVSKVESLLRRLEKNNTIQEGHSTRTLQINRDKFIVVWHGQELMLPKKEFELLELLSSRPGKVYTRDQILNVVWGNETIVGERTIDVHIRKLREKLGFDCIRTIKGVGYTYNEAS